MLVLSTNRGYILWNKLTLKTQKLLNEVLFNVVLNIVHSIKKLIPTSWWKYEFKIIFENYKIMI